VKIIKNVLYERYAKNPDEISYISRRYISENMREKHLPQGD
jgi:hypothetical protein